MGKLVSWLVLGALVWLAWRLFVIVRRRGEARGTHSAPGQPVEVEPIVRCDRCGIHVPRSEAIEADGRYYCSEQHRRPD
jgi:uncharacterized protein